MERKRGLLPNLHYREANSIELKGIYFQENMYKLGLQDETGLEIRSMPQAHRLPPPLWIHPHCLLSLQFANQSK